MALKKASAELGFAAGRVDIGGWADDAARTSLNAGPLARRKES
jgi:hypothetical protein